VRHVLALKRKISDKQSMNISQVAAQLYTLRDFCKTPQDTAQTLKKVRAIGYEAVQVSGVAPMPESELKAMLDGEGLVCCATHESTQVILDEPQKVIERLQKLDCKYTAVPSPGGIDVSTLEAAQSFAARMDAAGKALREAGQVLAYHNHHFEFVRLGDRTLLEIFYGETDPQNLQGEIDTYWVQYGGGDPVAWCKKLKNRLPLLHLKDYGIDIQERKPVFREIGQGNLNWSELIPAAENSGCQWFIVEQDTCPGDPFDSLKISFDYIQSELCR
jgi:sugar phosphate isomerase/epimerase